MSCNDKYYMPISYAEKARIQLSYNSKDTLKFDGYYYNEKPYYNHDFIYFYSNHLFFESNHKKDPILLEELCQNPDPYERPVIYWGYYEIKNSTLVTHSLYHDNLTDMYISISGFKLFDNEKTYSINDSSLKLLSDKKVRYVLGIKIKTNYNKVFPNSSYDNYIFEHYHCKPDSVTNSFAKKLNQYFALPIRKNRVMFKRF